jgi:spore coat protein U-like protein
MSMTPGLRRISTIGVVVLLVLGMARDGSACTPSPGSPASFGSMTSFVAAATEQTTSSTNAGITCAGSIAEILASGNFINATMTSQNAGLMGPSGDLIDYKLYADPAGAHPIQFGVTINYISAALLNLLNLFQGSAVSIPLYFRTTPGANVAQGTYQDVVTVQWHWRYCTGILLGSFCALGSWVEGLSTSEVPVELRVTAACQVTLAPDIDFGQAPMAGLFTPVVQSIAVLCTKDLAAYTVGLSAGDFPQGGRRSMANGAHRLQYDIFKGASPQIWGTDGADRYANAGPANGSTAQLFPYTAAIYPDQTTPPPGQYSDVIIVNVDF